MARNINKCTKRCFGRLYCAFMQLEEDPETGFLEERGCILKMKDEYRMYPETDSNGDVIHNRARTNDPFPPGVSVIWENDSNHDTGLTYSYRRLRAEEYNMHPLYSIQEINEPFVDGGVMGDDHAGYAFGNENMSISPSGWATQKVLGLQRVEDCNMGIYSRFDAVEKMVVPKCIRDYTGDIKGWVNYTSAPDNPRKKSFFICDEPNVEIAKYCVKRLGKTKTAIAIYQIMLAIKKGEYVNLREALINHGLAEGMVNSIMNEVSVKGLRTIYSNMNLQKYYLYWKALDRMDLPKEKIRLYKCHLLNYVLNYPGITRLDPNAIPYDIKGEHMVVPTNRRFWWVYLMAKDAIDIGNKTKKPMLTNPKIEWFRKLANELHYPSEPLNDYSDMKNPAVMTFYEIVGEKKESAGWQRRKRVFSRILRAGKRWSPPEVRVSWIYFQQAYDAKKPERFWQYVESVKCGTPTTVKNLIEAAGVMDDSVEFTQERSFSHHLLEARLSRKTFEVSEPKLHERWQLIYPKSGLGSADEDKPHVEKSEICWRELKKIWFKKNKNENILQILSDNISLPSAKLKELAEMYKEEIEEDVLMGTEVSKDDLGREGFTTIVDIDGNEDTFGGDDSWHDSESAE